MYDFNEEFSAIRILTRAEIDSGNPPPEGSMWLQNDNFLLYMCFIAGDYWILSISRDLVSSYVAPTNVKRMMATASPITQRDLPRLVKRLFEDEWNA